MRLFAPCELWRPEQFRLDALIRRGLSARNDRREVIADQHARYFGAKLSEHTLLPGHDARLGETRFEDWLQRSASQLLAEARRPHATTIATAS